MREDSVRQTLKSLPKPPVPPGVSARLRVMASHERERRIRRFGWLERLSVEFDNWLRPLAVPAAGGLLCTVILFGSLADTLNVRRYMANDIPLGIYTEVAVDQLSPFASGGGDLIVEVTIDSTGRPSDFSIPNGAKISREQLRQIGNLLLYSSFTPATAYGQPVSGKILVNLHQIDVRG